MACSFFSIFSLCSTVCFISRSFLYSAVLCSSFKPSVLIPHSFCNISILGAFFTGLYTNGVLYFLFKNFCKNSFLFLTGKAPALTSVTIKDSDGLILVIKSCKLINSPFKSLSCNICDITLSPNPCIISSPNSIFPLYTENLACDLFILGCKISTLLCFASTKYLEILDLSI